jgi:prepilin-type processing-associated H-X9-DG protein
MHRSRRSRRALAGFTLVELLVLVGLLIILLSIFIPYLLSLQESSRRTRCQQNLMRLRDALSQYAADNNQVYPRVVYDVAGNPNGYVAFTGPDAADPFAAQVPSPATQTAEPAEPATRPATRPATVPAGGVAPNDVTASLWLLVRLDLARPEDFVCPSGRARPDALAGPGGREVAATARGNFRSPRHMGYSYSSPFSSASGYRMSADFLPGQFVIMADINPGRLRPDDAADSPPADAAPGELARANSNNHDSAGQNALYADGHVEFQATVYCGVEGDNIYTALARGPLEPGNNPPANGRGVGGTDVAPAWNGDSYLVPTEDAR